MKDFGAEAHAAALDKLRLDREHHTTTAVRLVAAEAVAAAAMHLVMQWPAWEALNSAALAAEEPTPGNAAALMREAMKLLQNPVAAHRAMASFELLDAAVRVWAPHAHPAVSLASLPPRTPA